MESHNKIKKIVWTVFCSITTFLLTGTIWIRRTYGVLALAMVSESFRGGLKNKRILFVKYVMVPTLVVFLVSLIVNRWLKGSHRRSLTYVMGGLMAVSIGAAVIGLDVGAYISRQYGLRRQHWYDSDDLVMHALGSIDGIPNTNSREALENSYQQGNRLLECDMIMTSDWELVACHDWVFWNRNTEVEKPSGGGKMRFTYQPWKFLWNTNSWGSIHRFLLQIWLCFSRSILTPMSLRTRSMLNRRRSKSVSRNL